MSEYKVYAKLQKARVMLQQMELKKSGHNKFAGYRYFELSDFLVAVNEIFDKIGLCHTLEINSELAVMYVMDSETGSFAKFSCPMAEAHLKGCHPVQNLGASITYISRYLMVMALAICEHDALDATTGSEAPKSAKPITKDVFDSMTSEEQEAIRSIGVNVISLLALDDVEGAVEFIEQSELDPDSKTALWSLLDSKQRAAIKKFTTR